MKPSLAVAIAILVASSIAAAAPHKVAVLPVEGDGADDLKVAVENATIAILSERGLDPPTPEAVREALRSPAPSDAATSAPWIGDALGVGAVVRITLARADAGYAAAVALEEATGAVKQSELSNVPEFKLIQEIEAAVEYVANQGSTATPAPQPETPAYVQVPPEFVPAVAPPGPRPAAPPPTVEELRESARRDCAARKTDLSPLAVLGIGAGIHAASLLIFGYVLYWAILGEVVLDFSEGGDDHDRLSGEQKFDLATGIYLGLGSIAGTIGTTIQGSSRCWKIKWPFMFLGAALGSAAAFFPAWAYVRNDSESVGLGVLVFVVSPIVIPAVMEMFAFLIFRRPRYGDAPPTESPVSYFPPSPTVIAGLDGRSVAPALSLGMLRF